MDPRAIRPGWPASCVMLLSGAATLVLEIVWVRQLGLALGRTHAALSTVTAAFLAGLAGGAYLSVRCARPRAALIQAHLAAGTLGVLFPALVRALESALALLASWIGGGSVLFALISHALAGALVLVPALLLGTALPLVLRLRGESRTGWFSAASAAGAAAAALATGFFLLPHLGNAATARLGALLSLAAAAFAALIPSESTEAPPDVREPAAQFPSPVAIAVAVACFSSVTMLLELSFLRYFTLILGSTTFALSLILAAFIAGSSFGSLTADRFLAFARRRHLTASSWPGLSAVLAGFAVIALVPLLGRLPVWLVSLHAGPWSFEAQQLALFAVTTLTMLLPAMALGAVFPLAVAAAPRASGALIAASTTGSVAGTLAWGTLVLPALGLQRTLVACALALIGSGTAWCSGRLAGAAVTALALLAVQALLPVWKPHVMAAGVHHYANVYAERARQLECSMDAALESFGRILAYRDGPDGSVAVRQQADGTRSLVIDGKADASTMGDMRTQRLLGHLPALLGPGRRALVIGLGSGVTAGSLLSYGFERVDVVELSKDVVQYSPFFSADSRAPLADARTHLDVQDARALLARTDARWDVITSEPTNPWVAGAAALFTQEFFAQCRATLEPGGLMCQWVPAYHQSPDEFRAIVAGFARTFPHVTLWESTRGLDYLLIGSAKPLEIPMDRLRAAFCDRVIANDLAEVEIRDPEDLLSRFVCGPEGVERLTMGVVPVSDDRLELEFTGPRSRRSPDGAREIARRVARQQSDVSAFVTGAPPGLALDVQDRWLKEHALELLREGQAETAAGLLVRASQSALARGQRPAFLKGFFLASVRERVSRGDLAGARDELEKLAKLLPADPDLENERGQLLVQRGAFAEARAIYERLTKEAPDNPHGWRNLALTSLMTEDRPTAIRAARRALTIVPYEPELRNLLGRAFYQQGNLREALDHYTRALALDPASAESRVGLALVAQALGHDEPPMAVY